MPVSASASCCASAAGIATGDIAPMSRNGVSTTGWFAAQYSNWASSIRSSQRSGELQLISDIVAADVHAVGRVAGLHVEFARGLGDLLEHEVRVELDHVAVHLLAGPAEQLDRLRLGELDADLADDAAPAAFQYPDRVGGEDLVPGHRVAEHRHLPPPAGPGAGCPRGRAVPGLSRGGPGPAGAALTGQDPDRRIT